VEIRPHDIQTIAPGSRIDALCRTHGGALLAGTRGSSPAQIHRSVDHGATWTRVAQLEASNPLDHNVTCVAAAPRGRDAWALTGGGRIWRSRDDGKTWTPAAPLPDVPAFGPYQRAYGLVCLPSRTLLACDTHPEGGRVFRSTDGARTWHTVGRVSDGPLYRFQAIEGAVLVNGWSGKVHRSEDDGRTWNDPPAIVSSPLYATEAVAPGIVLQASEGGDLLRSVDGGRTWSVQRVTPDAADDLAHAGGGMVVLSTYTGKRALLLSEDAGSRWREMGPLPAADDWLDHAIGFTVGKTRWVVGGTGKGAIVRYRW
jgi:photosystem II stability/assembly factor-like uncharacterized protein